MVECPNCQRLLNYQSAREICDGCGKPLSETTKNDLRLDKQEAEKDAAIDLDAVSKTADISDHSETARNCSNTAIWFLIGAFIFIFIGLYNMYALGHTYSKDLSDLLSVMQGVGLVSIGFVSASIAAVFLLFSIKNLLQVRIKQEENWQEK